MGGLGDGHGIDAKNGKGSNGAGEEVAEGEGGEQVRDLRGGPVCVILLVAKYLETETLNAE